MKHGGSADVTPDMLDNHTWHVLHITLFYSLSFKVATIVTAFPLKSPPSPPHKRRRELISTTGIQHFQTS